MSSLDHPAAPSRTTGGTRVRSALSRLALSSALCAVSTSALASPAVFFNDNTTAGIQTFIDTVTAADTAYNTANPGATQHSSVFQYDITNSTGSSFSVTDGSTTVYVKTQRAGSAAANNGNGDLGSDGFTNWSVGYTSGDFASAISAGYTLSFFSDAAMTSAYNVNAVGLFVSDWGTCCTTGNTTPDGATANASQIYMLFNGSTPLLVGGISTRIGGTEHFVAAIDDRNSFSSVTLVPNGRGEAFGAGAYLVFSTVQIGSVPAGSSVVTVGDGATGSTPDINRGYSFTDLTSSSVNPVFDGGTLTANSNATISNPITIKSTGGTIDTAGHDATFTGALADASGATGGLTKAGDGTLTLAGANSYTGTTTVTGGTLALQGTGTIASSSGLVNDGTFDISGTDNGASVKTMSGTGAVELGDKTLTVTNGTGSYDGAINGTGGLAVTGGALALTGDNGFSGGLTVDNATVSAPGAASLGTGAITLGNGTLAMTGDAAISNALAVTSTGSTLDTGANAVSLAGPVSGNGFLVKTGTGTLTLSGANSQAATIVRDGTLAASSGAALGASDGHLYLGTGSSFAAGADMTVTQALHIGGANATFDTGANNVTLTGTADGLDCLNKRGSGKLSLNAAAANDIGACVYQGTLAFNDTFTGHVWVFDGGTGGGKGTINGSMDVYGNLAPGNSPGVLTVNGSVTQHADSSLTLDIDGATPGNGAGHHDQLILVGATSVYTAGGTIAPILRGITGDATNSYTPAVGSRYTVVTAEGGVTGTYAALAQPTAGLATDTRFDIAYNPNSVVLYVTPNSYKATGTTKNAAAVGAALDGVRPAAGTVLSGSLGTLLSGLYPLNAAGADRALEQASGEIYANAMDGVVQNTRASHTAVSDRLNGEVDGVTRDAPLSQRIWGLIDHDIMRIHNDGNGQGYRADNLSVVVGADKAISPKAVVGLAFAYGRSHVTTDFTGSAKAHSYHGIVYGRYNSPSWYANAMLSVGGDHYRVDRSVTLADGTARASGKTNGLTVAADAEAGYKLIFGKTVLTPALGLSYDRLNRDDLNETGDSSVTLALNNDYRRSLIGRAGARISTAYTAQGTTLIPYASAFVSQELGDRSSEINPIFHNTSFVATAAEAGRTAVRLNAGVKAILSPSVMLQANYRYSDAGNYRSNAVMGGVSVRW